MSDEFDSEYCHVQYVEYDNIVFLKWKKYCNSDDYRKPTMHASKLLSEHRKSNFIVDARNGFEDDNADVEWGFKVLLPSMAETECKHVAFIMNEVKEIEEEMDMWTREFMKYFKVHKVISYAEGLEVIRS